MKNIFLTLFVFSIVFSAQAFDQMHAGWSKVLSQFVEKSGVTTQVKYSELLKNQADLNAYLTEVQKVTQAEYSTWNEKQKLSFLFNAYNAFTIKLILNELEKNKDLKSIKKIGGMFGKPWKIKFFKFLGKEGYLDYIEQEIARKNFDEPRMHFAFNCASIGCPSLQMTAFVAENLDAQLDQVSRDFLKDSSRNELNQTKKTLALSSIFDWYKDDFENSKKQGPLKRFLLIYFPFTAQQKSEFEADKYTIKYLDYNWDLNKKK